MFLFAVIFASLFCTGAFSENLEIPLGSRTLVFRDRGTSGGTDLFVIQEGKEIFMGKRNVNIGSNYKRTLSENGVISIEINTDTKMRLQAREFTTDAFHVTTEYVFTNAFVFSSCYNLSSQPGESWYVGPEQKQQIWPINVLKYSNYPYVTQEENNAAISERYWLSSTGKFVYYDLRTPLFVNQQKEADTLCFSATIAVPYIANGTSYSFSETIGFGPNARDVHKHVVTNFLNKPSDIPDTEMIKNPIWSTWVKFGRDINEEIVLSYAKEINSNGFANSQLEIDDKWETCYGSLTFDTAKFSNIKSLVTELKALGFRVTLWVHPFINVDCEPWYTVATENKYLIADKSGNTLTDWWNNGETRTTHVDFTKPEAAAWFSERLKALKEATGIDSFKFDAGETSWMPTGGVLTGSIRHSPHLITQAYVREAAKFGSMIEVRSGQNTQDLPVFVRMVDKDSHWTINNGLKSLVTTLLQMNLAGYPFVIPDMIGGNAYSDTPPTKELFIRWLQANVFMPSLQYSIAPWDFDEETVTISKKFTELHAEYADIITRQCRRSVDLGEPVNAPIWWLDPTDTYAQKVNDEFLLGDYILAAPILDEDVTLRTIYLPKGRWMDGNNNDKITDGPVFIYNYSAPLNTLPYFINLDSQFNEGRAVVASTIIVAATVVLSVFNLLQ